jgi:hypothetical protein
MAVIIDGKSYTKTAFSSRWSEITSSYESGCCLCEEDRDFIDSALSLVPQFNAIKMRGSVSYKVRNKKFQGKPVSGVVMITPNSKREVWVGKTNVVNGIFPRKKPVDVNAKHKSDLTKAFRQLVDPQIKQFRQDMLGQVKASKAKCALTGQVLQFGEYHIDHRYPFKNLIQDWARSERLDLERIDVTCRGTKCKIKDEKIAKSFSKYHREKAELQATTAKANLLKGAKYYG